jgi:hypothetical protein
MTGAQVKALRDALCEAFTPDSLRQMLRTELDRQLDTLAGPGNFRAVVFELIETADREGWSGLLLSGARHANPDSPALKKLLAEHPELAQAIRGATTAPGGRAPDRWRLLGWRMLTLLLAGIALVALAVIYLPAPRDSNADEVQDLRKEVEALKAKGANLAAQLNELKGRPLTPELRDTLVALNKKVDSPDEDVQKILADPALTAEQKVDRLVISIQESTDRPVAEQLEHINALLIQGTASVDVETMKLKRLIDKRSQMYDTLRQIIDEYNETGKGIIDKIDR